MSWLAQIDWAGVLVHGVLLGGLYALFAIGLSLAFGIMRLVNIAHGDLIVLCAYVAVMVVGGTGLHPLASILIVVPLMAVVPVRVRFSTLAANVVVTLELTRSVPSPITSTIESPMLSTM